MMKILICFDTSFTEENVKSWLSDVAEGTVKPFMKTQEVVVRAYFDVSVIYC